LPVAVPLITALLNAGRPVSVGYAATGGGWRRGGEREIEREFRRSTRLDG
jgi:hypothetical protein